MSDPFTLSAAIMGGSQLLGTGMGMMGGGGNPMYPQPSSAPINMIPWGDGFIDPYSGQMYRWSAKGGRYKPTEMADQASREGAMRQATTDPASAYQFLLPATDLLQQYYSSFVAPETINQLTASGLGRSGAIDEALAKAMTGLSFDDLMRRQNLISGSRQPQPQYGPQMGAPSPWGTAGQALGQAGSMAALPFLLGGMKTPQAAQGSPYTYASPPPGYTSPSLGLPPTTFTPFSPSFPY